MKIEPGDGDTHIVVIQKLVYKRLFATENLGERMRIYIVMGEIFHESTYVLAVFSTKDVAEEYITAQQIRDPVPSSDCFDRYFIEEHEVDAIDE